MQNTRETIQVLNDLIQINNDRIIGYEKAIRQTKIEDADLKILYASMVAEGHRMKIALATEIQALGADADPGEAGLPAGWGEQKDASGVRGTTLSGKIYGAWSDVKAIFSGHNRQTILANCEGSEEAVQRAYRTALDHDLPAYIRQLLTRQQDALRASLDEIRAMRSQYV